MGKPVHISDFAPETTSFMEEVVEGLQKSVKEIPSKFFYDERGSLLFEQITHLQEYYPTRTEAAILKDDIEEIVQCIGHGSMLIEYGSGNSAKTRILLDHLPDLSAYVPIDISKEHLLESSEKIAARYPDLEVLPVAADYIDTVFKIPMSSRAISHRVVYYPGSTIGNFHPDDAVNFVKRIHKVVGKDGGLLLGVDLKKDPSVLFSAYNDAAGVTARFNLNMLRRINEEFGGDFDLAQWRHRAIYNEEKGRIEMHLVSLCDQVVHLGDTAITFRTGETIWTESSYKYSIEEFATLAHRAGFDVKKVWTDPGLLFSVQYLTTSSS